MPKLKSKLRNLLINRIDLVDSPDNPESKIMMFKREHEARKLWDEFVRQFLSVHNKTLAEMQANPPDKLSLEQLKNLEQRKPWSKDQAALEARKTSEGSALWQAVIQEAQPPLGKGIRVYTDIEQITKDTKDDVLATKGESWRAVEKMLKGRVKKSDYQADYNQILLLEMTRPTWNEYYAEYSKKPDVTDKEIQKREYDYTSAAIEIDLRAKRMVAKGESPDISQAYGEVCRRFPELEKKYRESQ